MLIDIVSQQCCHPIFAGQKRYEVTNHLGNVLAVITDRKHGKAESGSDIQWFEADLVASQQYYPFGMLMPKDASASIRRQYSVDGYDYRFGFNGKEGDDEVKGDDNQLDFGARPYDPRSGRWLSVDPMAGKNVNVSSYASFANNPLLFVDPDGEDNIIYFVFLQGGRSIISKKTQNSVVGYAQSVLTHHGLNAEIKLLEGVKSPINESLLDPTDRIVYIGSAENINKMRIPSGDGGHFDLSKVRGDASLFGSSGKKSAIVNYDKFDLALLPKDYKKSQ